jgi:hypothetical protein
MGVDIAVGNSEGIYHIPELAGQSKDDEAVFRSTLCEDQCCKVLRLERLLTLLRDARGFDHNRLSSRRGTDRLRALWVEWADLRATILILNALAVSTLSRLSCTGVTVEYPVLVFPSVALLPCFSVVDGNGRNI